MICPYCKSGKNKLVDQDITVESLRQPKENTDSTGDEKR